MASVSIPPRMRIAQQRLNCHKGVSNDHFLGARAARLLKRAAGGRAARAPRTTWTHLLEGVIAMLSYHDALFEEQHLSEVDRRSPAYIRWVQQSLNQVN